MTFVLLTLALAATSSHATLLRGNPEKGVGSVKDFAALLPFHPGGQSQSVVKSRCVNFVNHLLERSAYSPDEVSKIMPKCVWSTSECALLQQDLFDRLDKMGQKKDALVQVSDPMGPQPKFAMEGGLDDSVYGWCDTMENMIKKKTIKNMVKAEKDQKKAAAEAKKAAEEAAKKEAEEEKAAEEEAEKEAKKEADAKKKSDREVAEKKSAVKKAVQDVKKAVDKAAKEAKKDVKKEEKAVKKEKKKEKKAALMEQKDDGDDDEDDGDDDGADGDDE